MEQTIKNYLYSDGETIQQATAELKEAYKRPEAVFQLFDVLVASEAHQVRRFAAVLLKKRLSRIYHWQLLSRQHQAIIKTGILDAMLEERQKSVRRAIAELIGVLAEHNKADEVDGRGPPYMRYVVEFIVEHCWSPLPNLRRSGSAIFAILAETVPGQFEAYIDSVCELFAFCLHAAEEDETLTYPLVYNLLCGMKYLVAFVLDENTPEETCETCISPIVKSLREFSLTCDTKTFIRAFEFMEFMAVFTPKLLTNHLRELLEFCLETSKNEYLSSKVRVKCVAYIGWLVRLKRKFIVRQELVELIVEGMFDIMALGPGCDDPDDGYLLEEDSSITMTAATKTLDILASNVPPQKLIPPLLQILQAAVRSDDTLTRNAGYLCLAAIAEGCCEAICTNYLETMFQLVHLGITDYMPLVRNSALYALGQFAEHLQPGINIYTPNILPIFFAFLQHFCRVLRYGGQKPPFTRRMFYALESICANMEEEKLVPHLPLLMEYLFDVANPNNDVYFRELALATIAATIRSTKQAILPYFQQLIAMLRTYLVISDSEETISLRFSAIECMACLARNIGRENFLPLANETMTFALSLLQQTDCPDERFALYNLISSLAQVLDAEMSSFYPTIMFHLYETLNRDERIPEYMEDVIRVTETVGDRGEMDIEIPRGEDINSNNISGFTFETSYLNEKQAAILALKVFAESTGSAFLPHLEQAAEHVFKLLKHPHEEIRQVSMEALTAFVISLHEQEQLDRRDDSLTQLLPEMNLIIQKDEFNCVVTSSLECLSDLLSELQECALPNEHACDEIFTSIYEILLRKIACQFNEPPTGNTDDDDDMQVSEIEENILEQAAYLVPRLGESLTPEKFAAYFAKVCPILLQRLQKSKENPFLQTQRAFIYGALGESLAPLECYTGNVFQELLPVVIEGLAEEFHQSRQNAVFALGELVLHSEDVSFQSYPEISLALSQALANETDPATMDTICGAIARLITTNYSLVKMDEVLPLLLRHLPLRINFNENISIFKCFKLLHVNAQAEYMTSMEQVLTITLHVMCKKQFADEETYDNVLGLLTKIREQFPDIHSALADNNPYSNINDDL